jgi:hypothetical protein
MVLILSSPVTHTWGFIFYFRITNTSRFGGRCPMGGYESDLEETLCFLYVFLFTHVFGYFLLPVRTLVVYNYYETQSES